MKYFVVLWVEHRVWGFRGDSHGFSVGMGGVWGLKSNPHGSLGNKTIPYLIDIDKFRLI